MAPWTAEKIRTAALVGCGAAYETNRQRPRKEDFDDWSPGSLWAWVCDSNWARHVPAPRLKQYLSNLENPLRFGNFDMQGVHGLLAVDRCNKRCWVVFRGTSDGKSWLHNVDYGLVKVKGIPGKVHSGFATQLEAALPVINKYVRDNCPVEGFSVCTAGHSLGGALATMYASYVKHSRTDLNVCCVTFGSPRAGDAGFADALTRCGTEVLRFNMWTGIKQWDDRITHVPAAFLGFKHAGEHRLLKYGEAPDDRKDSLIKIIKEIHDQKRYLEAVFSLPCDQARFSAALTDMPREELPDNPGAVLVQIGLQMVFSPVQESMRISTFMSKRMPPWLNSHLMEASWPISSFITLAHQPDAHILDHNWHDFIMMMMLTTQFNRADC